MNTRFKRHNTIQSLQGICLHNVLVQLEVLKCGGTLPGTQERRHCIDLSQLLLEDYCPRCAAMYWARRGLEE